MSIFNILTLIGGLALFLYGMDEMGNGLKKLSGGKLESILAKLTSNKYKGFLLGFLVTAIIQSSSATTVMLVGFVNSGIMNLAQSIGIIFGANVGTTVTSWLVSLTNIGEGASTVLKLFKPSSFTPILGIIGVALLMMAKKDKNKNIGTILIGFTVLMFGMDIMSGAMEGLKDASWFSELMVTFKNPLLGVLVGTLLTAIIQSSSASVGILQALSLTGAIPFSVAFPIVLGQNIGTTITPIISALGANTGAKRVAFACLYIKIIGVIVFLVLYYIAAMFIPFFFMEEGYMANPFNIALFHTVFNFISSVLLLPFSKLFEKMAIKTFKEKQVVKEDRTFAILDTRFLSTPSFAIAKCRDLIMDMIVLTKDGFSEALQLMNNYSAEKDAAIREKENLVDRYEDELSSYLVRLSEQKLSVEHSREVAKLLHVVGDIERISDHSINLVAVAKEMHEKKILFSDDANAEIKVLANAVTDIIEMTSIALIENDLELATHIEPLEQIIDKLQYKMKSNHIKRLQDSNCTIELGFIFSDFITNCERASDHCSNIAACILEISNDSFGSHEYIHNIHHEQAFEELYQEYKSRYRLPRMQ